MKEKDDGFTSSDNPSDSRNGQPLIEQRGLTPAAVRTHDLSSPPLGCEPMDNINLYSSVPRPEEPVGATAYSVERLQHLIDTLPALVAYVDNDLRYRIINAAYERWFGQSRDALIGKSVIDVLGVAHYETRRSQLEAVLRGEPQRFEIPTPKAGDQVVNVEVDYIPCRAPDGRIAGFYVLAADITERKHAESALRDSEARQRAITEASPDCIKIVDAEGRILHMNPAGLGMLEAPSLDSVHGDEIYRFIVPEDRKQWLANHRRVLSGEKLSWTFGMAGLAGTRRQMETHAVPLRLPDGRITQLAVARDITEHRATEKALQEQGRILETINRTGAALAAELDLERVVQMVTDAGVELTGAEFGAFFYNVLNDAGESYMLFTLTGGDPADFEKLGYPRATTLFRPTFDGEGVIRSDNITVDPRFGLNPPYYGMPNGHLPVCSYLAVPVVSRSGEVLGGLFFGHSKPNRFTQRHEQLMVGIAGQAATAIDNARLYQAAQREIYERRRAEEALRTLNEELEQRVTERTAERDNMWRLSRDIFLVIAPDGKVRAVNPAVTELLGYNIEALVGQSFRPFVHPEDRAETAIAIASAAQSVSPADLEIRLRAADGTWRWFSWVAAPGDGLVYAVGRDITADKAREAELSQVQEALRQSQKLEAIGQLTGGVAHDFNNLLTVIRASADLLRRDNLPEDRRRRYAEAILETADRAAKLTSQLLSFARRQALRPEVFELCERVRTVADMLRSVVGSRITILTEVMQTECYVEADATQFETAVINMAVNARDAMNGEGTIRISVAPVTKIPRTRDAGHASGNYVAISMADSGSGIPADQLGRIFEPCFTTKEVGKGTGLGLSQVYGFAKQSGGEVHVESVEGKGATFTIYLPRVSKPADRIEDNQADGQTQLPQSRRRVLIVEDNAQVGEFAGQLLTDLGYSTAWANNAQAALDLLAANPARFDIVFSDVVMPGMSGLELAKELQARYPALRVVLTSGYSHVLALEGTYGFELLQKPYSAEGLAQILGKIAR